jgi:hypothetical protein
MIRAAKTNAPPVSPSTSRRVHAPYSVAFTPGGLQEIRDPGAQVNGGDEPRRSYTNRSQIMP